jgi:PAS domain S-box-containing protein
MSERRYRTDPANSLDVRPPGDPIDQQRVDCLAERSDISSPNTSLEPGTSAKDFGFATGGRCDSSSLEVLAMIWATDPNGLLTYIGPEWAALTGQPGQQTQGEGWLEVVHPDDRDYCRTFFLDASASRAEFTMRFRVRHHTRGYVWLVGGALPSFGPPEHTFLGYLGSLAEIAPSASEHLTAYGTKGAFRPPVTIKSEPVRAPVDLIADHILMAHVLAAEADEPELKGALDVTLRILSGRLSELELQPFGVGRIQ